MLISWMPSVLIISDSRGNHFPLLSTYIQVGFEFEFCVLPGATLHLIYRRISHLNTNHYDIVFVVAGINNMTEITRASNQRELIYNHSVSKIQSLKTIIDTISQLGNIKFCTIPPVSLLHHRLYQMNKYNLIPSTTLDQLHTMQKHLIDDLHVINSYIHSTNQYNLKRTICLERDIQRIRNYINGQRRISYKWNMYYDGVHSHSSLSKKWILCIVRSIENDLYHPLL